MAERASRELATEVVVVGGGPAGIAAACAAAGAGSRVLLLDASPRPGGQVWRHRDRGGLPRGATDWLARLDRSGAELLSGAEVVDIGPGLRIGAAHQGGAVSVTGNAIVLATGAQELFLPFPGWTLPGVVGVGGAQALLKSGMDVRGRRVAIAGTGPLLLPVAAALARAGADLRMVAEQAPPRQVRRFARSLWRTPARLVQAALYRGAFPTVRYRWGTWVSRVVEHDGALLVTWTNGTSRWQEPADLLCTATGLVPCSELARMAGCDIHQGAVRVGEHQETSVAGIFAAGEPTGNTGMEAALVEGAIAGLSAAGQGGSGAVGRLKAARDRHRRFAERAAEAFRLRPELRQRVEPGTIVCRCEDVALEAIRPGWTARESKLATRAGMGACQGRICGPALHHLFGAGADTVRMPAVPTPLGVLHALTDRPDDTRGVS